MNWNDHRYTVERVESYPKNLVLEALQGMEGAISKVDYFESDNKDVVNKTHTFIAFKHISYFIQAVSMKIWSPNKIV